MSVKLVIVVVLYNRTLEEAAGFQMLMRLADIKRNISIHVYDNSKQRIAQDLIPAGITYKHNPANPGLATAYNWALRCAIEKGGEWLMLLDHDTLLNVNFIGKLLDAIEGQLQDNISIIMPVVVANGRTISPVSSSIFNYHNPIRKTGILRGAITGINSATTVRVGFLKGIGGFNEEYPLDYLDHWLFSEVERYNHKIYVLEAIIDQDLSIYDFLSNVSITRYVSILEAKHRFYKNKGLSHFIKFKASMIRDYLRFKFRSRRDDYAEVALRLLLKA